MNTVFRDGTYRGYTLNTPQAPILIIKAPVLRIVVAMVLLVNTCKPQKESYKP